MTRTKNHMRPILCGVLLFLMVLMASAAMAAVDGFTLINADSNQALGPLPDGIEIDLASISTRNLNIRADTSGTVSSVSFTLSGAENRTHSEGVAPYALFGDSSGDYNAWTPTVGTYLLSADADGSVYSIAFGVVDGGGSQPPPPGKGDGDGTVTLSGERRRWHKVTLDMAGPWCSETDSTNPFLDYAMTVTFTNGNLTYQVAGYFAADGDAANTSAVAGNVWRAHLSPDETGTWSYTVSVRHGANVAVMGGGSALAPYDGVTGSFSVQETNKTERDHRGKGRLQYVGKHHLRFAGSGEYFLKAGADAPENFLAYDDFDNTPDNGGRRKDWAPHKQDWNNADPTWGNGEGKGIIGALNYLSEEGMNVFSFLTMNINGDDRNVYPYIDSNQTTRIDVSKTAQWEVLFEHADRVGMYLHFKTQETENDQLLDGGALGIERRLYYRELIARFAHLGEENTNTDAQRREFAQFFYDNDPYHHNIVVHTYPGDHDKVYAPMLGNKSKLTGASIQTSWNNVYAATKKWVTESAQTGRPWVVANDEQGSANVGVKPDSDDPEHNGIRIETLWGNIMAGGAGVEYYFGYSYAHSDLTCNDFRSRDAMWDQSRHALRFFSTNNVPFWNAQADEGLSSNGNDFCLYQDGQVYVVFLKQGGATNLNLSGQSGSFTVTWYDPRNGGALQNGSVTSVNGGGPVTLGTAPNNGSRDWVILVRRSGSGDITPPAAPRNLRATILP